MVAGYSATWLSRNLDWWKHRACFSTAQHSTRKSTTPSAEWFSLGRGVNKYGFSLKIPASFLGMSLNISASHPHTLFLLCLSSGKDSKPHSTVKLPQIHLTENLKNHAHQKRTRRHHSLWGIRSDNEAQWFAVLNPCPPLSLHITVIILSYFIQNLLIKYFVF